MEEHRRLLFILSILVTVVVIYLLLSGSPLMTMPLDAEDTIPLGTFTTWAGFISFPLSIYLGINGLQNPKTNFERILATALKCILILALLWVPISYLLAGNISFSFTERSTFQGGQSAMRIFWRFTYLIPIASLFILLLSLINLFLKRR